MLLTICNVTRFPTQLKFAHVFLMPATPSMNATTCEQNAISESVIQEATVIPLRRQKNYENKNLSLMLRRILHRVLLLKGHSRYEGSIADLMFVFMNGTAGAGLQNSADVGEDDGSNILQSTSSLSLRRKGLARKSKILLLCNGGIPAGSNYLQSQS